MNTPHTPAPWQVTQGTNGFTKTWQVEHVSEKRHCTIADCGAVVNQVYQGSTENYVGDRINSEHEANARLIASLPELLATLEAVCTFTVHPKLTDAQLTQLACENGAGLQRTEHAAIVACTDRLWRDNAHKLQSTIEHARELLTRVKGSK